MMVTDPLALKLEKAMVLQCGVQYYLNMCFDVEADVTAYTQRLQFLTHETTIDFD